MCGVALGTITTGTTPSKQNSDYYNSDDICFIKPDLLSDSKITLISISNEYISENARTKARIVGKDSIFVTCIGTIGKIGIASDGEYAFNQQINVIKANDTILPKYLAYALFYSKPRLEEIANAPVVPIINKTQFESFTINIEFDKTKQNTIVSTLDKLQSIITHRKQQLEKLDLLVKARFVEMFGDTEHNSKNFPIHKLCDLCTVSSSKRIYQNEQSSSGIPFLRISNLVELIDNSHFETELFIPEDKYLELLENGLVPQKGDILVTSRGTLGKCYIIQSGDKFYFQDGMISWLYDFDDSITPLYLTLLFGTRNIERQISNLQSGSTVAYLSITMLKKLEIVVPPLKLQQQFAAFVEQTQKTKAAVQKALDEAQVLFDSLMQEYFG